MRRMRAFRILAVAAAVSLAIPAIALPVAATEKAKPYVVVMAADPIAAYAGGTRGIAATKPTAGKKVDRRSAAARQYQSLLQSQHDSSLQQGGLPVDVAETVAWFSQDANAGVTGNVVRVCGQSLLGA